jgi:hypothetical protein
MLFCWWNSSDILYFSVQFFLSHIAQSANANQGLARWCPAMGPAITYFVDHADDGWSAGDHWQPPQHRLVFQDQGITFCWSYSVSSVAMKLTQMYESRKQSK